jgi:hypothetical protein
MLDPLAGNHARRHDERPDRQIVGQTAGDADAEDGRAGNRIEERLEAPLRARSAVPRDREHDLAARRACPGSRDLRRSESRSRP